MLYLGWLMVRWIMQALVPAALVFAAGAVLLGLVWLVFLRRRRRAAVVLWGMLVMGSLGLLGWRTWEVWSDFTRPQFRMFRTYIANPIPESVRDLSMATPAPAMFHDGALLRFRASDKVVRQILDHSLSGSRTWAVVEEMKRQSARDPADRSAVVGADGRSYVKVDVDMFPKEGPEVFRWARSQVEAAARSGPSEAYVLLLEGEWGSYQSVLIYDAASGTAVMQQYLERRRQVQRR